MGAERCPDCGNPLVFDHETGETACSRCGLVVALGENIVPGWMGDQSEPYSGVSKTARIPVRALAGAPEEMRRPLSRVGRRESPERAIQEIHKEIEAVAAALGITNSKVLSEADAYAAALRRSLENSKMRMSRREIALVSIWRAAQIRGVPILLDEVERFDPILAEKLYKLLSKSSAAIDRVVRPPRAVEYARRLICRVSDFHDQEYVTAVEDYAISLLKAAERLGKLKGKDPTAAAGTAIHIADEELGSRMSRKVLEALGIKYNERIAKELRKIAVPFTRAILTKKMERVRREVIYDVYRSVNGRAINR